MKIKNEKKEITKMPKLKKKDLKEFVQKIAVSGMTNLIVDSGKLMGSYDLNQDDIDTAIASLKLKNILKKAKKNIVSHEPIVKNYQGMDLK